MPQNITGTIEFNDVSYAYKDQLVLDKVNFTIPNGQKVGIIGPSGGGKSTILKLIPLFIEPREGSVTIDGIDTQSVSLKELRKKIAWVSQTPQLFNEDIFENLLEGDRDREVSDDELVDAVEVSNITEFVSKMPMAFRTPVGEDGGSLSGGQRQRISIGRALIKNAPIICLDEPTAALDVKSENYIRDSLSQMIQGKTVVMVTHRKPLLDLMDVIYVLENGQLTDVNNLGGLEAYLAKLEGLEIENAETEIEQEIALVDPSIVQEFLDMYESNDESPNLQPGNADELNRQNTETTPYPGVQLDQSQNTDQHPSDQVVIHGNDAKDVDDEIEINLH